VGDYGFILASGGAWVVVYVGWTIWQIISKVRRWRAAVPQHPGKEYLQHLERHFRDTDPLVGEFVRSTRFLVIGGTGFTGSAIVHELRQHKAGAVRVMGRSLPPAVEYPYCQGKEGLYPLAGVEYVRGDVTSKDSLIEALEGIDVVFHTACSYGSPSFTSLGSGDAAEKVNYHGMLNLLEVAKTKHVKCIIYTSSVDTVFCGKDLYNINETQPYKSLGISDTMYAEGKLAVGDHYSRTKIMAEKALLASDGKGAVRTLSLRPNGIYGPGENNAYPKAVKMTWILGYWPFHFRREQRCDWIGVASLAHAHILGAHALNTKPDVVGGRPFFVSDDNQDMNTATMGIFSTTLNAMEVTVSPLIGFPHWLLPWIGDIMERFSVGLDNFTGVKIAPFITRKEGLRTIISQTHDISAAKADLGFRPVMTTTQCQAWTAEEMVRRYKVFE